MYGASDAAGYAYGHALSSSYSSTGCSPGYGVGSYGARGYGVAMKREEKEMRSFSVREDEEEAEGVIERDEVGWDGDEG